TRLSLEMKSLHNGCSGVMTCSRYTGPSGVGVLAAKEFEPRTLTGAGRECMLQVGWGLARNTSARILLVIHEATSGYSASAPASSESRAPLIRVHPNGDRLDRSGAPRARRARPDRARPGDRHGVRARLPIGRIPLRGGAPARVSPARPRDGRQGR